MKRTIPLWLGLLAFAIIPAFAQTTPTTPAPPKGPTGKIHGHVTNPTGAAQKGGTVTLVAVGRAASGPGLSAQMADKGVSRSMTTATMQARLPPAHTLSYTAIRI